jgi:hypothetical protein
MLRLRYIKKKTMNILAIEDLYSLVESFESRTITKAEWTHSAHLIVGLYYCRTLPFAVAKNLMRDGILWLNDEHGTPNTDGSGYHETLTVFWLKRIWNFLDERGAVGNLATLANELIEKFNDPDLPLKYYSREVLFSASARREYVSPDRRIYRPLALSVTVRTLNPLI